MAHLMNVAPLRAWLVRSAITRGIMLADLLADDGALEAYVRENAASLREAPTHACIRWMGPLRVERSL